MLVFFLKKIQKEKCKFLLAYFSGCAYTRLRYGGSSSVGRAPGCGPGGRGFKSHLSPHKEMHPAFERGFSFSAVAGLKGASGPRRGGMRARTRPCFFPVRCAWGKTVRFFPVRTEGAQGAPFFPERGAPPAALPGLCGRGPQVFVLSRRRSLCPGQATTLAASGWAALAKAGSFAYKTSHHGAWRSMVAHLLWEQGVAGSNPVAPTIHKSKRPAVTSWPLAFMIAR